jgi:hypothetical protein
MESTIDHARVTDAGVSAPKTIKRNYTFCLDPHTQRAAARLAARKNMSLSGLIGRLLDREARKAGIVMDQQVAGAAQ